MRLEWSHHSLLGALTVRCGWSNFCDLFGFLQPRWWCYPENHDFTAPSTWTQSTAVTEHFLISESAACSCTQKSSGYHSQLCLDISKPTTCTSLPERIVAAKDAWHETTFCVLWGLWPPRTMLPDWSHSRRARGFSYTMFSVSWRFRSDATQQDESDRFRPSVAAPDAPVGFAFPHTQT
jgi:hypothetical protein